MRAVMIRNGMAGGLRGTEAAVIIHRKELKDMTLDETGRFLGMSRQGAKQAEERAYGGERAEEADCTERERLESAIESAGCMRLAAAEAGISFSSMSRLCKKLGIRLKRGRKKRRTD